MVYNDNMNTVRLRKKTEYAIAMMVFIAKAGKGALVPVASMKENDLPRSYLVKIARDLIKAKLIIAKEGRSGGYSLAKDADMITLKDIVEAIKFPQDELTPNLKILDKLSNEFNEVLLHHNLSEFK
jgi:Rrf2 family protein